MTNLRNAETRVTKGDSRTLTGTKRGDWYGCHKHGVNLHCVTLYGMVVIPGLHEILFSMTQALKMVYK